MRMSRPGAGPRLERNTPMKKSEILDLLRDEPEELDVDKFIYTLYVRRQIERGIAAADAGDEVSQEEFEQLSEKWLK